MDKEMGIDYELIAKALFENYENIYDIDLETGEFSTFHESEAFSRLKLNKAGDDFFGSLRNEIKNVIAPDDQEYVIRMLDKDNLIRGLDNNKYYSFLYRIIRDGKEIYHQIRATYQPMVKGMHVFMGVRDVDYTVRQAEALRQKLSSMHQKESNHMEAVLATAAAYMEANLTKDIMLEKSDDHIETDKRFIKSLPPVDRVHEYSSMHEWICENLIVENKRRYSKILSRDNLLKIYNNGEKRTSMLFSVYTKEGVTQPCREVVYLYQDKETDDIFAFCVIYDLTEQQKKEREMERLEEELRLSRLHNFTSQMQPHFLYNALGSIQEVILMDPEYASDLLGDFTVHLRSCIRAMVKDEPLSFSQELENVKAYINIEKMRFGDKLRIHYNTDAARFSILPLTIQPIVENAVRHGIYGRGTDGGDVYNGTGFDVEKYYEMQRLGEGDSTGLRNIEFRLEKVMNAHMDIDSKKGKGTTVTVRIPKGENDESDYS